MWWSRSSLRKNSAAYAHTSFRISKNQEFLYGTVPAKMKSAMNTNMTDAMWLQNDIEQLALAHAWWQLADQVSGLEPVEMQGWRHSSNVTDPKTAFAAFFGSSATWATRTARRAVRREMKQHPQLARVRNFIMHQDGVRISVEVQQYSKSEAYAAMQSAPLEPS